MKKENLLNLVLTVIVGVLVVVSTVKAATTISTNIVTEGTLSVTGTTTLMGNVGIGTTPLIESFRPLSVNGNGIFGSVEASFRAIVGEGPSNEMGLVTDQDDTIAVMNYDYNRFSYANDSIYVNPSSGNVGIASSSPSERLVVNGNVKITGTTNGVKVYRALLTQTGTDAPVATVLENTLGGTPVWSRISAGYYSATLNGVFLANKTWTPFIATDVSNSTIWRLSRVSDNEVVLDNNNSIEFGDTFSNVPISIEILVYP